MKASIGQPVDAAEKPIVDEEEFTVEGQVTAEDQIKSELVSEPPSARETAQQICRHDRLLKRDINAAFYRLTLVEERLAPVERTLSRIEKRLPPLEVAATLLEKRQQPIESLIRDFRQRIEAMETLVQQVAAFTSRLEAIELKTGSRRGRSNAWSGTPSCRSTWRHSSRSCVR